MKDANNKGLLQVNGTAFREFDFFGLRLHDSSMPSLLSYVERALTAGHARVLYGYSLTIIPRLREVPEIATLGNLFDVLLPEGRGMYLLANLFGARFQQHISLPELVEQLLAHADHKRYSVFLLGATAEVNSEALANIRERFLGIQNVEGRDGYFSEGEEQGIFDCIKQEGPEIVLIGISSPKKERVATKLRMILPRSIIVPCGGVIDILGEKAKREPAFVRVAGLTWLYRFAQEPRRLFRPLFLNGLYFIGVLFPRIVWKRFIVRDSEFSLIPLDKTRVS